MEIPANLKYTEEHEWVRVEGAYAYVGITDFAQSEVGEVVYVEIETKDQALQKGDEFGSVESVKAVSELYMPVSGTIAEINEALEETPEIVNSAPYTDGWMIKVKLSKPSELEDLMDAEAYKSITG